MRDFSLFTYKDAADLFTKDRRPETALRARKFHQNDPWQDGWGYAAELPPNEYPGREFIIANLRANFISENVIFEVTDTHTGGVLGTEPMWDLVRVRERQNVRQEGSELFDLGETLTAHWDERESLQTLTEAAEGLVLEGRSVLYLYFPEGMLEDGERITGVADLSDALKYLYCDALTADVAGVFTDPKSKRQIGVYLFEDEETKAKKADVCYLDDDGKTVLRRLTDGNDASDDFGPYDLGGHLFLYELKRPALITDAVQSNQRGVNMAHTNMTRNTNLAGNRTTDILNGRVPGDEAKRQWATGQQADSTTGRAQSSKGKAKIYKSAPGWVNEIWGLPIYNEQGTKIIGYTQPVVNVREPVPVDSFVGTRDHFYGCILSQCFMLHKLISGDATASGKSREQARKEYERSLKKTAVVLNAAGRWLLETELRMAAELANDSTVKDLRAVFECNVEKVPISAEERQENRADLEAGVLDDEEVMRRAGVEDTGAMKKKVEAYQREKAKRAPGTMPSQPPIEDQTGEGLPA